VKPLVYATIRVCIDLKLFDKMQEGGRSAKSVDQLAKMTGADPKLLGTINYNSLSRGRMLIGLERFLKHLAAADIVEETNIDEYASNAISTLLATPPAQGVIINW